MSAEEFVGYSCLYLGMGFALIVLLLVLEDGRPEEKATVRSWSEGWAVVVFWPMYCLKWIGVGAFLLFRGLTTSLFRR